jgi:hypothetical protein
MPFAPAIIPSEPAALRLTPDRTSIRADGDDLSCLLVEAVDKDGNLCPLAMNDVRVAISGPAVIAGVGNGPGRICDRSRDPVLRQGHGDSPRQRRQRRVDSPDREQRRTEGRESVAPFPPGALTVFIAGTLSHPMGEGRGEGAGVLHPAVSYVLKMLLTCSSHRASTHRPLGSKPKKRTA